MLYVMCVEDVKCSICYDVSCVGKNLVTTNWTSDDQEDIKVTL